MLDTIRDRQAEISVACRRFGVATLELFGSARTGKFDPVSSDVDFVVDFTPEGRRLAFDNYFGLRDALAQLLGARIELMTKSSLRNPIFKREIEQTAELIYGPSG